MFNHFFTDDSIHPDRAYEIEKRVRAREEQMILWGYQGDSDEPVRYRISLTSIKKLFANFVTSPKAPRNELAVESRK